MINCIKKSIKILLNTLNDNSIHSHLSKAKVYNNNLKTDLLMRKYYWSVFILILISLQSCKTYKNVPYFMDVNDSARLSVATATYHDLLINPGDAITVTVQTIDVEANAIFNQMPTTAISQLSGASMGIGGNTAGISAILGSASAAGNNANIPGYVVNNNGQIELPMLGKITVAGLSTQVASDTIQNRLAELYKMPVVTVRFANLRVTVLGEVLRPGTFVLSNEKNTIFDALAQANDLTIYGKRENALLIRDSAGQKNFIRFNLNSKDLVKQDFFYLKQNDVIYIVPGKSKAASLDIAMTRNITIAASILSLLIVTATRVK